MIEYLSDCNRYAKIEVETTDSFGIDFNAGVVQRFNRYALEDFRRMIDQALNTSAEELGDVE